MDNKEKNQPIITIPDGIDFTKLIESYRESPDRMAGLASSAVKDNPLALVELAAALTEQVQALTGQVKILSDENNTLHRKVATDDLTGAYKKSYLIDYLARSYSHVAHERRQHHTADVLLMIDLDGFKPINDTLGHEAGDEALKRVVTMLQENTRETDIVVRAGGDEFIVLLRGTEETDAIKKAGQIGDKFDSLSFQWDGHKVPVRASIGITKYDPSQPPQANLAMADDIMFEVKRAKGDTRHQKLDLGGPQ